MLQQEFRERSEARKRELDAERAEQERMSEETMKAILASESLANGAGEGGGGGSADDPVAIFSEAEIADQQTILVRILPWRSTFLSGDIVQV